MDADSRPIPGNAHVCVIAQDGAFGGTELHTLGLLQRLAERGYRITLIESTGSEYERRLAPLRDRVRVVRTAAPVRPSSLQAVLHWIALLRSVEARTMILAKSHNRQDNAAFALLLRAFFDKVIVVEHLEAEAPPPRTSKRWLGVVPGLGLWWRWARLESRIRSRCADKVVCVSAAVRNRLVGGWGYDERKAVVVRNGVDWRAFARDAAAGARFRREHGIPEDAFVYGMLCRLTPAKGVDIALQAFHRLEALLAADAGVPRGRYLLIGGDGEQREQLEALAAELGVRDRVRFLGFVTDQKSALSAFDVILYPSRLEGLPLGLLEGMAAGCLPIISLVSGMPEVVDDRQVGWAVPKEDPEALAAAMRSAAELDESSLRAMRAAATKRVESAFDIEQSYRNLLAECGL